MEVKFHRATRQLRQIDDARGAPLIATKRCTAFSALRPTTGLRPLSQARAIDVTFNRAPPMGHPEVLAGLIPAARAYFTDKPPKELDMHWQRDFVSLVTLAVAAAVPAWGQATKQSDNGTQAAASIPDFSGVWAKP